MPKVIIAKKDPPEPRTAYLFWIETDESVLDKVIILTTRNPNNYEILREVSQPQEDFALSMNEIPNLRNEIHRLLSEIGEKEGTDEVLVFLLALDGVCQGCNRTKQNLYGLAD